MSEQQRPTVGRIVHYVEPGLNRCRAAIVTGLDPEPGGIYLTVFEPGEEPGVVMNIAHDEETHRAITWHWPEREP